MLSPVKKTKHNLRICYMWNIHSIACDTVYFLYKNPSATKIRIFNKLDLERREMNEHSQARGCANCYTFTYMYTFKDPIENRLFLRRISKGSEEDIEVVQE